MDLCFFLFMMGIFNAYIYYLLLIICIEFIKTLRFALKKKQLLLYQIGFYINNTILFLYY